jgi:AbrB family looped-hinge helix DNA binding protein
MTGRNTAKLSSKFQISIPKAVRDSQGWKPGQEFAFVPSGGGYILVRVPSLEELRGLAKGADTSGYRDRTDRY